MTFESDILQKATENEKRVRSFTAASTLPWKLLKNDGCVIDGKIKPVHLQISPTNRCNANCSWCSCSEVDRTQELPIDEIIRIFGEFEILGARAVTITGGGEPTIHPDIQRILYGAAECGFNIGMVTNGLLWGKKGADVGSANNLLTWLRVSTVEPSGKPQVDRVKTICERLPDVDVGISFTVPADVNIAAAVALCEIVDGLPNLTHIRFVQDILYPDSSESAMTSVCLRCRDITDKAIFQSRNVFTKGHNPCWISKLKPYVDANGYVFACCGFQYAHPDSLRKLNHKFSMCHWSWFYNTSAFDGSVCQKCYYNSYNLLLDNMVTPLEHQNFV